MRDLKILSTGQLAKFCGVDHRTILRWIRQGHLKAFQLPGRRGDNRIPRAECLRFMREHDIPIPPQMKEEDQTRERTALVVEDDHDMAQLIKIFLSKMEFSVTVANDGFKAGTLLHTLKPGLLVLDLNIPLMNGFEVLQHISRNDDLKNMAILIVSGLSDAELDRALEEGADAALPKPFAEAEFIKAVESVF